jgi:hypothetical protein
MVMPTPLPDHGRGLAQQNPDVLLAMLIFGEARHEPFVTKLSIGFVAMNRWNSGLFGDTIQKILLAPDQFQCFDPTNSKHLTIYNPTVYETLEVWQESFIAGLLAKLRLRIDPTDNAFYFHDESISSPPLEGGQVEPTCKHGTLTFYRRSFAHSA